MDDTAPRPDKRSRARRTALTTMILVGVLCAGVFAWNRTALQSPMQAVLDGDPRNEGVSVRVHFKRYLMPNRVVFDLRDVNSSKAPVDVFRIFLQFAESMKDEQFDSIELAFRGEVKFVLDGAAFQEIGKGMAWGENPMFIVRTFPERLRTPDGDRAFGRYEGGDLAVFSAQMEDFNEFHRRWYIEDL